MNSKVNSKPYIAGAMFALLVGFSFLGVKICVQHATPLQVLTFRYDFALIAMVILWVGRKMRPELRGRKLGKLILTGSFYVLFMVFQTTGLQYSTSIESAILFTVIPIIVIICAGLILKEKPTVAQNITIFVSVIALIAMIILGASNLTFNILGISLLFISSVCMALNNVMMRYIKGDFNPIEITSAGVVIGFIAFNLVTVVHGLATGTLSHYMDPAARPEFLIATFYLGAFCIMVSNYLMSYMQANITSTSASLFGNVATAISIVAGAVVLKEPLYWYHIVCTLIILGAVITNNMYKKKEVRL